MSIEIKGLDSSKAGRTEAGQAASASRTAADARGAAPEATAPVGDTVRLTDAAQALSRLEAQVKSAPEVDSRRVEQLRAAVESGTYKVDADAIAAKLLNLDASLPNG
jgi:negative regulator of flagellin synthesis FlgM